MRISTIPALAPLILITACGSGDNRESGNASQRKQAVADVLPKSGEWEMTTGVISVDGPGITEAMKKEFLSGPGKSKPEKHCLTDKEAESANWLLVDDKSETQSCHLTMKDGKISGSCTDEKEKMSMTVAGNYGVDRVSMDATVKGEMPPGKGSLTTVMRMTGKRIANSCTSKS